MIRSHDALRRSEQEQEILQVVEVDPARSNGQPASGPIPVTADPESSSAAANAFPPLSQIPLTFDGILAHCNRTPWTPHPQWFLFLEGEEQTQGAEEFRALRSRLRQPGERRA